WPDSPRRARDTVRRYPLDPEDMDRPVQSKTSRNGRGALAPELPNPVAGAVLWLTDLRRRRRVLAHSLGSSLLTLLGGRVIATAALTDTRLPRGVESGVEFP